MDSYRHLTSGNVSAIDRMQNSIMAAKTIASQNPKAINYTNSLVERTRDIRNWLKQAKNEHEFSTTKATAGQSTTTANPSPNEGGVSPVGAPPSQSNQ